MFLVAMPCPVLGLCLRLIAAQPGSPIDRLASAALLFNRQCFAILCRTDSHDELLGRLGFGRQLDLFNPWPDFFRVRYLGLSLSRTCGASL